MDLVSDVLSHTLVKGHTTGLLSLRGEWAFEAPPSEEAVFHIVSKGSVLMAFQDQQIHLSAGDMAFFPRSAKRTLSSGPDAPTISSAEEDTKTRFHTAANGMVTDIVKDGDGPETNLVCAQFEFGRVATHGLANALPDCIVLRREEDGISAWIDPLLRQIAAEAKSDAPGAIAALDSLLNVLFIQFLRTWLKSGAGAHIGWVRGLGDPQIANSLERIHKAPQKPWSVQDLAQSVGMSRSNFASRFMQLVGVPPARYIARWRMVVAAHRLEQNPSLSVSAVAFSVGYDSEASFSEAFKRHFGMRPGAWRRGAAQIPKSAATPMGMRP